MDTIDLSAEEVHDLDFSEMYARGVPDAIVEWLQANRDAGPIRVHLRTLTVEQVRP